MTALSVDRRRQKREDNRLKCWKKTTEDRIQLAKVSAEDDWLTCQQKTTEEIRQLAKVLAEDDRR